MVWDFISIIKTNSFYVSQFYLLISNFHHLVVGLILFPITYFIILFRFLHLTSISRSVSLCIKQLKLLTFDVNVTTDQQDVILNRNVCDDDTGHWSPGHSGHWSGLGWSHASWSLVTPLLLTAHHKTGPDTWAVPSDTSDTPAACALGLALCFLPLLSLITG